MRSAAHAHSSNLPDELSTILKTNPVLLHVKFGPDGAFFVKTPDGVTCLRMSPRDPLALTVHSDQPPSKAYGRQAANKLGVPLNKIDVFAYSQRGYVAGTNVEGGQRFAWSDIPESLSRTLDAYLPDPHKGNIYDITISYAGDWMILFEGGSVKYSLRNNEHAKLALSELKPPFQVCWQASGTADLYRTSRSLLTRSTPPTPISSRRIRTSARGSRSSPTRCTSSSPSGARSCVRRVAPDVAVPVFSTLPAQR